VADQREPAVVAVLRPARELVDERDLTLEAGLRSVEPPTRRSRFGGPVRRHRQQAQEEQDRERGAPAPTRAQHCNEMVQHWSGPTP
jgi:hypothetical protein